MEDYTEIDNSNPRQVERKRKTIELAAMLKEKRYGTLKNLSKILHKYCVQEGVKMATIKEYLESFQVVGLVTITNGNKRWKYHPEAEWDLFRVTIA
jgi:hypothetical protein